MPNLSTRKLKIIPITNENEIDIEAYKFISDATYAQYQGLNRAYAILATAWMYNIGLKNDWLKNTSKELTNTNPIFDGIKFGIGIDTKSAITRKVKKDFGSDLKNGLAKGERCTRNYKRSHPLITRSRDLNFYYGEDEEVYLKWVHGIVFKVLTGRKDKDYLEVQHTLRKIINGEYKVAESKIDGFDKKILILQLTFDMGNLPTKEKKEGRVIGVDLGVSIPAIATVSDSTYIRKCFGSGEEIQKQRNQFRSRRKRVQKQLALATGGKGRTDKLSVLNKLRDKEQAWIKTYQHQLSSKLIDFAVDNQASQINLEKLDSKGFDDRLLSIFGYYGLSEMIKYKAERAGIIVKFVNPAYTSQQCSSCGHIAEENRPDQKTFECVNCHAKFNADYNASINIARSTNYIEEEKKKKSKKKDNEEKTSIPS